MTLNKRCHLNDLKSNQHSLWFPYRLFPGNLETLRSGVLLQKAQIQPAPEHQSQVDLPNNQTNHCWLVSLSPIDMTIMNFRQYILMNLVTIFCQIKYPFFFYYTSMLERNVSYTPQWVFDSLFIYSWSWVFCWACWVKSLC